MKYCFDCIARYKGYRDASLMFKEMTSTMTNKEIAKSLSVNYGTVKNHLHKLNIKTKGTWGGPRYKGKP